MKKIGEYTARGIVTEDETTSGTPQKIPLFDGSFKTGYRVTGFHIWGSTFTGSSEGDVIGKLSKNAIGTTGGANFLRADDDNQIAWAGMQGDTDSISYVDSIIDRDNLVIEDLYVYVRGRSATTSQAINYLVELDKYEISESQGALMMARDRADGE